MTQNNETPSANVRAIAQRFRLVGWISFWIQLVLGVISGVIVLLYAFFSQRPNSPNNNPGTGFGVFLAVCGLIVLGAGIYLAFRYTRIGKQLDSSNPSNRPRKQDSVQMLRLGLWVNLGGILFTLLGAQAIVGTLVARSISPQAATTQIFDPTRIISGLDMLVVQANTNTISAHFAGLVCSLFLLNRITK
jgi:quinol-cytochrome oxidoreductase complex cytochrome b subunit